MAAAEWAAEVAVAWAVVAEVLPPLPVRPREARAAQSLAHREAPTMALNQMPNQQPLPVRLARVVAGITDQVLLGTQLLRLA